MSDKKYKSRLHQMTQSTPTCLWNDSASMQELTISISTEKQMGIEPADD